MQALRVYTKSRGLAPSTGAGGLEIRRYPSRALPRYQCWCVCSNRQNPERRVVLRVPESRNSGIQQDADHLSAAVVEHAGRRFGRLADLDCVLPAGHAATGGPRVHSRAALRAAQPKSKAARAVLPVPTEQLDRRGCGVIGLGRTPRPEAHDGCIVQRSLHDRLGKGAVCVVRCAFRMVA